MHRSVLALCIAYSGLVFAQHDNQAVSPLSPAGMQTSSESPQAISQSLTARADYPSEAAIARASSESEVLPEPLLVQPVRSSHPVQPEVKSASDHKQAWLALAALQHGSAIFDAWSTRQALSGGAGYERDILVRPFANSSAVYPALQILPLGLDLISRHMLRSSHSITRKSWWVPQTVATVGFVWCGARNVHVAR